MRKHWYLCLFIVILLFCTSCKKQLSTSDTATPEKEEEQVQEQEGTEEQDVTIEEKHSEFYMEEYSVEEVLQYFNEIVLATEYTTGTGNAALIQRWDTAICYQIVGACTEKDIEIIKGFFNELNKVEGFPGAKEVSEKEIPNLYIYFEGREAFDNRFMEFLNNEYADGAVRYWYDTDMNNIYEATIGYCTDMSEEVRDSVLLEELVNCLGIGDTTLRDDSIVYQYGSDITELSEMDWLIIKLLHHPKIRCGMDSTQCEEIIRELYY